MKVLCEESGLRVDSFLSDQLEELSRSQLQKLLHVKKQLKNIPLFFLKFCQNQTIPLLLNIFWLQKNLAFPLLSLLLIESAPIMIQIYS